MDSCRWGLAVFVSWVLLSSQAVCAAAITVDGDAPLKRIDVTIEGATLNNVVKDLSQKYGFDVKGLENLNNVTMSAHMSGNLPNILEALLRRCHYCNYMLLRSPDNKSGIEKLIIFNSTREAATWPNEKPNADADAPSQSSAPFEGMF